MPRGPELVPAGAVLRPRRQGLEAGRVAGPRRGCTRLPDTARRAAEGHVLRPGRHGLRPRRPAASPPPRATSTAKPAKLELDPATSGPVALTIDQVYHGPPVPGDGAGQAGGHREQAADRLPRPADAAARRRRPAKRSYADRPAKRYPVDLRDPRLRRHPLRGPRRGPAERDRRGRRRDALRRPRPVVPAGPPRLRRLGEQRALRPGPGRGADPAHREDASAASACRRHAS